MCKASARGHTVKSSTARAVATADGASHHTHMHACLPSCPDMHSVAFWLSGGSSERRASGVPAAEAHL